MKTIGIDLGGTRIKGIVLDENGTIHHQVYTPTRDGDNDSLWKTAIKKTVTELASLIGNESYAIGLSAPGLPDKDNTAIHYMPGRLQGLEKFVWSEYLGSKAYVLNDAVSALMAESAYGAARGKQHVALITLGTGVGGALLLNGQPYQGDLCRAGHLGHIVIDHTAEQDVTGMPGSLEDCIGNCTIVKRTNGKYTSTHEMINAFTQGDPLATKVWLTSLKQLAIGIASIINVISPEVIVIGGGIAEANDLLFVPLNEYLKEYEWRPGGHSVPIVKAQQGDLAGAVGAAVFARSKS